MYVCACVSVRGASITPDRKQLISQQKQNQQKSLNHRTHDHLNDYRSSIVEITALMITPLIVIQVYAPTNDAEPQAKETFYQQLQQRIDEVPKANMLMLMGDFNAKLGCEFIRSSKLSLLMNICCGGPRGPLADLVSQH